MDGGGGVDRDAAAAPIAVVTMAANPPADSTPAMRVADDVTQAGHM
jgi:hypothetical protein